MLRKRLMTKLLQIMIKRILEEEILRPETRVLNLYPTKSLRLIELSTKSRKEQILFLFERKLKKVNLSSLQLKVRFRAERIQF